MKTLFLVFILLISPFTRKIDYLESAGIADRQAVTNLNADSKFKIASVTKVFSSVLILQLCEQGKVQLNTPIGNYLPGYRGEAKDRVTIHHLLTHSSGLPDCEGNKGLLVYQMPLSTEDFIANYCSGNLVSEPGKQFSYNNGDYILPGKIIETVTGKSFRQNPEEKILLPPGMKDTQLLSHKNDCAGHGSGLSV